VKTSKVSYRSGVTVPVTGNPWVTRTRVFACHRDAQDGGMRVHAFGRVCEAGLEDLQ